MPAVHILDGGLGTELVRMGYKISHDPLWSASLLAKDGEAVTELHRKFISKGATVATTLTYQASVEGFVDHFNLSADQSLSLIGKSVELAQKAFASEKCSGVVAGSVGPYGACKHDLSEYHGNYVDNMDIESLIEWHRPRIAALVDAGCDLLAFETIPALKEAHALVLLLKEFPGLKAWLSFFCKDSMYLGHGDLFSNAVEQCLKLDGENQLIAVGVNCCEPNIVYPLLNSSLNRLHANVHHIAYPNSGRTYVKTTDKWIGDSTISDVDKHIKPWISGVDVRWLGGCCSTTPDDIAALVSSVQRCGFKIEN